MKFTSNEEALILDRSGLVDLLGPEAIAYVKSLYSDAFRRYHDWQHALSVLAWVNHVCDVFSEASIAPYTHRDLRLAALFHDVTYTSQWSPGNEQDSVKVLYEVAGHVSGVDRAAALVMATSKHGKHKREEDHPLAVRLFLDCDLAFAFAEHRWEVFVEINRNVELEYMQVYEPALVKEGRIKFLTGMLENDAIFLSDYFGGKFEEIARLNLQRMLREQTTTE